MAQTAALFKPAQKILEAIKDYTIKIDSEETTISDYPLKAALIYEGMQKWGVSAPVLAETLGKTLDVVNAYLDQRIDPSVTMDFHGTPYRELDRAKIERQIKLVKKAAGVKFQGGMDDDWYTHDMAQKLAIRGVSDLQQLAAKHNEYVLPVNTIVYPVADNQFVFSDSEGTQYPIDSQKIKKTIEGGADNTVEVYRTTEPITLDLGISYWYNKENGQQFPIGGDAWESAFEGKGGVYYKVKLTDSGLPVFYTQWFSTSDFGDFLPVFSMIGLAFGLPLLLGETVLGAVGITASEAVSTAVGNIAINTAITGGDVTHAIANAAASFAGGQIGGQIGETVDSVAIGQAATVATTAALKGKQIDILTLATALASDTGTKKMDETEVDVTDTADQYVYDFTNDMTAMSSDVYSLSFEDIGLDTSIAVDLADSLDTGEVAIEAADLVDDAGNVYDFTGDMTAMSADAYLNSLYPDAEGIKDGYNNVVIPADQVQNMTSDEVAQEIQRYMAKQADAEVSTGERTENTPAANPAVAKTAKMPSLPDSANAWDKLLKTAVSIGASVKAIANGTFRPTYQTSAYGTPRAAVGVPVQRADGSIVTNNGNGTQTIRYPNGQVQTVSTNYTGSGVFSGLGISTQTLLIGGAVLLGVALLARRK